MINFRGSVQSSKFFCIKCFICALNFCGWSQVQNYFNSEIFPIYGIQLSQCLHPVAARFSNTTRVFTSIAQHYKAQGLDCVIVTVYGHVLDPCTLIMQPKALITYVAGRSEQYRDSSLELCSRSDHSNNLQHIHHSWYGLLQHMILR